MFRSQENILRCHALHYLQMATELLGKAYAWRSGPTKLTHRASVKFLKSLSSNPKAQKRLGYEGQNESWTHLLRKSKPLAEQIEDLAPALAGDNPNPEYPWPPDAPTETPVAFDFSIWAELTETAHGRQFLKLVSALFLDAEAYL
ncbi:MAG: hypothetical protein JWO38_4638 [Gemmataceae bacterium]|nr:hypothetical protein [Gemmataceae bacterium]